MATVAGIKIKTKVAKPRGGQFMDEKYVKKPVSEIPAKETEMMERPPMDFVTKFNGSKNMLVQKN